MSEAAIRQQLEDRVLHLIIDRPEKKNAITMAMYDGIREGLQRADRDADVRVVLVRGTGGTFTAGNDLMDFRDNPPENADSPVGRFLDAIVACETPILAAVEGPAIGIGTTLLLHCDLVYCSPEARFQMPFVPLGLSPEGGSSFLLPRMAGHRKAAELLLFGERFDAETAAQIGLVNRIVPKEQLLSTANERAAALVKQPAASVRLAKSLLKRTFASGLKEQMDEESRHFFARLRSPEAAEAMRAFFERREPDFSSFE